MTVEVDAETAPWFQCQNGIMITSPIPIKVSLIRFRTTTEVDEPGGVVTEDVQKPAGRTPTLIAIGNVLLGLASVHYGYQFLYRGLDDLCDPSAPGE